VPDDPQAAVSESAWTFDGPRAYLFVSARERLAAAEAVWSWADAPPDLCVTSPSKEAHDTAAFAFAGYHVSLMDEPMLARRLSAETEDGFTDRFAKALRMVSEFDTRAALVVCDEFPVHWATPFFVDGEGLAQRATLLERELPLP